MNSKKPDHILEAEHIQTQIYKRMTPTEKWNECKRIRQFAWELKGAAVRMNHPEFSEDEVQSHVREIFLYATT